jgi:hypothetical protein
MEQIVNHKGGLCQHKFLVCQEGFCSECMIHLNTVNLRREEPRVKYTIKQRTPVFVLAR